MNSGRSKLGVGAGGHNGFGDRADAHLPRVALGEGDGPEVEYRDGTSDYSLSGRFVLIILIDAVLDAMGYHANMSDIPDHSHLAEEHNDAETAAIVSAQVLSENMSLGDSITVDSESRSSLVDEWAITLLTSAQIILCSLPRIC